MHGEHGFLEAVRGIGRPVRDAELDEDRAKQGIGAAVHKTHVALEGTGGCRHAVELEEQKHTGKVPPCVAMVSGLGLELVEGRLVLEAGVGQGQARADAQGVRRCHIERLAAKRGCHAVVGGIDAGPHGGSTQAQARPQIDIVPEIRLLCAELLELA